MTEGLQKALWKLEPNSSDHIPGTLALCIGMPVMIRHNDATELCITRGQEAIVVGWDSKTGPYESITLETLFVELINTPKTIKIAGLPENVVPIPKSTHKIQCMLSGDLMVNIKREQVNVLPNFSMTDYASQGKTRQYNIVDLSCSQTFHHMYTSLSRSSKASNTYILSEFDERKITCGISGYLRKEFRDLNILIKITELLYTNKLDISSIFIIV